MPPSAAKPRPARPRPARHAPRPVRERSWTQNLPHDLYRYIVDL